MHIVSPKTRFFYLIPPFQTLNLVKIPVFSHSSILPLHSFNIPVFYLIPFGFNSFAPNRPERHKNQRLEPQDRFISAGSISSQK